MRLAKRWREFWQTVPARFNGSYVARNEEYVTRLKACAPTVTPEEAQRLADKPRTDPVDFTRLPIG